MRKTLLLVSLLTLVLLVVSCAAPGGGGPSRNGSTASTGGMEYVFTPDASLIGNAAMFGLAYGQETYVAVGPGGAVISSSDGTDWSISQFNGLSMANGNAPNAHPSRARSLGIAGKNLPPGRTLFDNGYSNVITDNLLDVAYGAGKFIAVGYNGTAWSSTDGADWGEIDSLPASGWSYFQSIAFLNNTFVAFGYDSTQGSSVALTLNADGSSWTSTALPDSNFYAGAAYGNGVYVAVTWCNDNETAIYTSASGTAWTDVPDGSIYLPDDFYSEGSDVVLTSVAFHDGVFVAVGTGYDNNLNRYVPLILVSTDGFEWISQDLPNLTPSGLSGTIQCLLTGVTATDAGFVAVGDFYVTDFWGTFAASMVLTSTNGRSWQHDYYASDLSGGVVSGSGFSSVGLGENLYCWWAM
jgi:hypothetical protein